MNKIEPNNLTMNMNDYYGTYNEGEMVS